jgi:hypothetical protein
MPAPVPLWRQLSRAGYYRRLSQFLHIDPGAMMLLRVREFALLTQWIFEQSGLETHHAAKRNGRLDLELTNRERRWNEFARCYLEGYEIPVDLGADLAGKLKNTQVRRVHMCTLRRFTAAQKQLRAEFPLSLEIVEGEDMRRRLREAQQLCHARLARQRRAPLNPI